MSAIREKNDSLFEAEKSDKLKNHFNNSILNNNQEINIFDQTNYDHLIDFDLDNIDLDYSNNQSTKLNKNNINDNFNCDVDDRNNNFLICNDNKHSEKNEKVLNKFMEKDTNKDRDGVDKELEFLKEKWMKALSG